MKKQNKQLYRTSLFAVSFYDKTVRRSNSKSLKKMIVVCLPYNGNINNNNIIRMTIYSTIKEVCRHKKFQGDFGCDGEFGNFC